MANHLYDHGHWIFISAFPLRDKTQHDIYILGYKKEKLWGYNWELFRNQVVILLKEIIPDKVAVFGFMDCPITVAEAQLLKPVFEREIKKILAERAPSVDGFTKNIFGDEVWLDMRNNRKTDSYIYAYHQIYTILDMCVQDGHPAYLSID